MLAALGASSLVFTHTLRADPRVDRRPFWQLDWDVLRAIVSYDIFCGPEEPPDAPTPRPADPATPDEVQRGHAPG